MHNQKLDEIDLLILEILQTQGRIKRNQLAEHVNLSIPSVSERLRKLETCEVIRGYHATLTPARVDLQLTAFVMISVEASVVDSDFVQHCNDYEEVLECHGITGKSAFILKVRTHNTDTLSVLLDEIRKWEGVSDTNTSIVLQTHKESNVLPLKYAKKWTQ